jgi:hypothetical protein
MIRATLLLLATLSLCGCDAPFTHSAGHFALFETSKGTVYRLNTASGETEIIYSSSGKPKLTPQALYESDDGKTYEYLGGGQLKELSLQEAADKIVEKYKK